jgi:hypothetical protein
MPGQWSIVPRQPSPIRRARPAPCASAGAASGTDAPHGTTASPGTWPAVGAGTPAAFAFRDPFDDPRDGWAAAVFGLSTQDSAHRR